MPPERQLSLEAGCQDHAEYRRYELYEWEFKPAILMREEPGSLLALGGARCNTMNINLFASGSMKS